MKITACCRVGYFERKQTNDIYVYIYVYTYTYIYLYTYIYIYISPIRIKSCCWFFFSCNLQCWTGLPVTTINVSLIRVRGLHYQRIINVKANFVLLTFLDVVWNFTLLVLLNKTPVDRPLPAFLVRCTFLLSSIKNDFTLLFRLGRDNPAAVNLCQAIMRSGQPHCKSRTYVIADYS